MAKQLTSRRVDKHYRSRLKQVNKYQQPMKELSDLELQGQTERLKARFAQGESLDDLLPEAFATIREAAGRILGLYPYEVQVIGGVVLHEGKIAEMKTGEGKTLTAVMPLYLNALPGKTIYLMTTNEYLSARDAEEMRPLFEWLGLSVAIGFPQPGEQEFDNQDKKRIYQHDIVYTTHSAFGFDYLFDNLTHNEDERYLAGFDYAIVDEVDSVLLDTATTPLVISGSPRVQSNLYQMTDTFVKSLEEETHYRFDKEKEHVWLTQRGMDYAEQYFRIDHLYASEHYELSRHIWLALQAHHLFELDENYVIEDNEVKLLNKESGRTLQGTRMQGGFHQAIEAKEHVKLTTENRSIASITYQNLFRKFTKLAGMSGTVKVAEDEFIETYNLPVVVVPTNKPVIREDLPDEIYMSLPEKITASIRYILERHAKGQPLLIICGSVTMSILYSNILLQEGIAHNLLNAYNAAKEAEMIAEAGQMGRVTVATTMAGRGTDIKLGPGVKELGGLAVIVTERMLSKRIDLQMKGRAGRQGDPGMSITFASMEDKLMTAHGNPKLRYSPEENTSYRPTGRPLTERKYQRALDLAQQYSDDADRNQRDQSLRFDEDMRIQREIFYYEREVLQDLDVIRTIDIEQMGQDAIDRWVETHPLTPATVNHYILQHLDYNHEDLPVSIDFNASQSELRQRVSHYLSWCYQRQIRQHYDRLGPDLFLHFVQLVILKSMDECWIEQVDYLEQLKQLVQVRMSANRNPMYEYQREAAEQFVQLRIEIGQTAMRYLALSRVEVSESGALVIYYA